jgi:hypothetical protein
MYTLLAIPSSFQTGPCKGELKGLTFIAHSAAQTVKWFAIDVGQFDSKLADLLSPEVSRHIMQDLRAGFSTPLPGLFQAEQFAGGFHQNMAAESIPAVYESHL